MKCIRYKNNTGVALTIQELNLMIPAGGYSAPVSEDQGSLSQTANVFKQHGMIVAEIIDINEMTNVNSGVISEATTAGHPAGVSQANEVIPAPPSLAIAESLRKAEEQETAQRLPLPPDRQVVAGPVYVDIAKTSPQERLHAYADARNKSAPAAIREAVQNTVVAIRDGGHDFGEIPTGDMADVLQRNARKNEFAKEVPQDQYIDEAVKIINKSMTDNHLNAGYKAAYPMPEGTPTHIQPWFQLTMLQKKIMAYKTQDVAYSKEVLQYEKNPDVVSCINQKLAELEPVKGV